MLTRTITGHCALNRERLVGWIDGRQGSRTVVQHKDLVRKLNPDEAVGILFWFLNKISLFKNNH